MKGSMNAEEDSDCRPTTCSRLLKTYPDAKILVFTDEASCPVTDGTLAARTAGAVL